MAEAPLPAPQPGFLFLCNSWLEVPPNRLPSSHGRISVYCSAPQMLPCAGHHVTSPSRRPLIGDLCPQLPVPYSSPDMLVWDTISWSQESCMVLPALLSGGMDGGPPIPEHPCPGREPAEETLWGVGLSEAACPKPS